MTLRRKRLDFAALVARIDGAVSNDAVVSAGSHSTAEDGTPHFAGVGSFRTVDGTSARGPRAATSNSTRACSCAVRTSRRRITMILFCEVRGQEA